MTVRQVFYRAVAAGVIEKTEAEAVLRELVEEAIGRHVDEHCLVVTRVAEASERALLARVTARARESVMSLRDLGPRLHAHADRLHVLAPSQGACGLAIGASGSVDEQPHARRPPLPDPQPRAARPRRRRPRVRGGGRPVGVDVGAVALRGGCPA